MLPLTYERTYNLFKQWQCLALNLAVLGLQTYIKRYKVEVVQTTSHESNLTVISNGNSQMLYYMQNAINHMSLSA